MQPRNERVVGSAGPVATVAAVAAVTLVAVLFQLPIFDRWFSHMDEGHVLLFADLIAKGGDLYRDATLYPLPGAFYLLAQFYEVFGASILLSRWIVMLEFAAFVAIVFVFMRRFVAASGAWATVALLLGYRIWAFPHWQVYSYTTTSLLAIAIATMCLLAYLDQRRTRWVVASGLFFGLAVYCKQDYGAAALLVLTSTLVVHARRTGAPALRPALLFVGSGAFVGALVGLYFFVQGILPDLIQQTVVGHMRGIGAFEYTTFPSLFPLFSQDPEIRTQAGLFAYFPGIVTTVDLESLRQDVLFQQTIVYDLLLKLFYWGPYPFALFALVRCVRSERPIEEVLLAGFTVAFVLLLTVNRPQDFLHSAVLVWPMLCLLVVYFANLFDAGRGWALVLSALLLLPAAPLLAYTARSYLVLREQNSTPVEIDRAGIRARPSDAEMLRDVTAFMRDNSTPDETVGVMPYFPIASFLADRVGPHRSAYIVWPHPEFEDRDERIIRALETKGTNTLVYNFTQFRTFPRMREFAPTLFGHIVDHYELARVFSYDKSGYRLAGLTRSDVPETASAFVDAAWPDATLQRLSTEAPPFAILPRDHERFVRRERWPFRRAIALRPSQSPARTVLRLPITPEAGAVLETAVSLHPEKWFEMPSFETRFEIAVVDGSERASVYARTLNPHHDRADRQWFDVSVPLDAWAGRDVDLELSVEVDASTGESLQVGGFAEPRISRD